MNDRPKDDAESPIERALRLKKASLDAKSAPPGRSKFNQKQSAGMAAGASKPWMKK